MPVLLLLALLTPVLLASAACGNAEEALPPNVQDPERIQNADGALGFYREVVASLPAVADRMLAVTGILTDELAALPIPDGAAATYTALDSQHDLKSASEGIQLYGFLHQLRAQAREARGFLGAYAPDSSSALTGHLYALEGYAELALADVYCSGIPLSTVDFRGDYTLTAGFTTTEVYSHALQLFDSAIARTADSASLQALAAVGRGRALLSRARYAEAAAAVAGVPDEYRYQVVVGNTPSLEPLMLADFAAQYTIQPGQPSVADREGEVGLDYRSSGDPRSASRVLGSDKRGYDMYFPLKYDPPDASLTLTLASGVEARLIEAEAALQANPDDGQWLAMLNHLRQTAWSAIVPAPAGPLPDLIDPGGSGLNTARVDLLFRERAFWLFLTGHRQGDLRRLVRQYGRAPESVYPRGRYPGGSGEYGSEIVIPVPEAERKFNPKYTGCNHQNA